MGFLYLTFIAVCLPLTLGEIYSSTIIAAEKSSLEPNSNPLKLNDIFSANFEGNYTDEFQTFISVGTPPKPFRVIINTHQPYSWLPAPCRRTRSGAFCDHPDPPLCDPGFCQNPERRHNPKESKSIRRTDNFGKLEVGYRKVTTRWYLDAVRLGDLSDPNSPKPPPSAAIFASADAGRDFVGSLGLGLPVKSSGSLTTLQQRQISIFESFLNSNRQKIDHPWFTLSYNQCANQLKAECKNAGEITFGGMYEKICNSKIQWLPPPRAPEFWSGMFSGLVINGIFHKENFELEITTRYNGMMFISKAALDILKKTVGIYKNRDGYFEYHCDRHFTLGLRPTSGADIRVTEEVLRRVDKPNQNPQLCSLYFSETDGKWNIPLPFLRDFCIVHDWDSQRVGLAQRVGVQLPIPTSSRKSKRPHRRGSRKL